MKRAAPYDIDEHTFEEKQRPTETSEANTSGPTGRKIFKLARPDNSQVKAPSKVSLNIQGLTTDKKQEPTPQDKQADIPNEKSKAPSPANIFSFNLFNNSQGIGLFSSENTFVNLFSKPSSDKKESLPPQPILGTNQTPSNSVSNSKEVKPATSSLFPATNLFNNGSIFNIGNTNPSSLFANSGSIFGSSKPVVASADNNEDEGDSEELQKGQDMEADPSKSTFNYQYDSSCKLISSIKVSKYKKDNGGLIENVIVSVLHDQKSQNDLLIVRLAATKNAIFNGLLLAGKSKIKILNNKAVSMQIFAFCLTEGNHKQLEGHRLKIMVDNQDQNLAKQFHQDITQIVDGKPNKE